MPKHKGKGRVNHSTPYSRTAAINTEGVSKESENNHEDEQSLNKESEVCLICDAVIRDGATLTMLYTVRAVAKGGYIENVYV